MNGALDGNAIEGCEDNLGDLFTEQEIVRPERYARKDPLRQTREAYHRGIRE